MPSLLGLQPQSLLQAVLDDVNVALVIVDKDERFVFHNQTALDMFEQRGDLSGASVLEWRRTCKFQDSEGRDIPAEKAPILRALRGERVEPQDMRVTLPNGRHKWLHVSAYPFSVMGLAGSFLVVTDETEGVELRRIAEQLHRLDTVALLAGGMAHDFNNMLTVVSDNIALALFDEGVPETTRTRLQQVKVALQKAIGLSKRLLQCSRMQKLQTRPVQINEVISTALELASPVLRSGIHLRTDLQSGLPAVAADPLEIEQVLVNLIMNAVDAMPEGGELGIHTEIALCAEIPNTESAGLTRSVLITVTDTGIGIPEEIQARIFEPCLTTKPGKGVGLGLSSAFAIVRQHRGRISVQSIPGAGTKFSIYLPAVATL
jgi:two-component system, cell cycle sensor histidine kinase and response regulator CckA